MPFDGTQLNEAAQHLIHAKAYIEEHGWCPFGYNNAEGNVCMLAALDATAGVPAALHSTTPRARFEAYKTLKAAINVRSIPAIGGWNDRRKTTKEAVYAAFDRAIALAMSSQP